MSMGRLKKNKAHGVYVMNMKFLAFLLLCAPAQSVLAETLYYIGEAVVTKSDGTVTREPYIVARTSDSAAGTITEAVVSNSGTGFNEVQSVLKVTGSHFTMTVSTGTVTGEGDLTGEPWKWTFLRAEFKAKTSAYSMRIVDYNFLADPNSIGGHKDYYLTTNGAPGEKLIQQEDVVIHPVDKAKFEAERARLLGR